MLNWKESSRLIYNISLIRGSLITIFERKLFCKTLPVKIYTFLKAQQGVAEWKIHVFRIVWHSIIFILICAFQGKFTVMIGMFLRSLIGWSETRRSFVSAGISWLAGQCPCITTTNPSFLGRTFWSFVVIVFWRLSPVSRLKRSVGKCPKGDKTSTDNTLILAQVLCVSIEMQRWKNTITHSLTRRVLMFFLSA